MSFVFSFILIDEIHLSHIMIIIIYTKRDIHILLYLSLKRLSNEIVICKDLRESFSLTINSENRRVNSNKS